MPKTELQQKGKEPYFQNTIRLPQGEVYLSEINLNREHSYVEFPETPVIRAALPIYGANQKVVGLIIINRLMEPVFDELRQCVKSDHILMLTNLRGEYLMHPDPSHTFGSQLGNSWTVQKEYPPVQEALLHSQSTQQMIVERTPHHKCAVLQVYKVHFDPSDPARFVAVVLAVPYDHVIADSALAARRSLIIGGIILMLSLRSGTPFRDRLPSLCEASPLPQKPSAKAIQALIFQPMHGMKPVSWLARSAV